MVTASPFVLSVRRRPKDVLHYGELEAKCLWSGSYEVYSQLTNTGCSIYKNDYGWTLESPAGKPLETAGTIVELLKHYQENYS